MLTGVFLCSRARADNIKGSPSRKPVVRGRRQSRHRPSSHIIPAVPHQITYGAPRKVSRRTVSEAMVSSFHSQPGPPFPNFILTLHLLCHAVTKPTTRLGTSRNTRRLREVLGLFVAFYRYVYLLAVVSPQGLPVYASVSVVPPFTVDSGLHIWQQQHHAISAQQVC